MTTPTNTPASPAQEGTVDLRRLIFDLACAQMGMAVDSSAAQAIDRAIAFIQSQRTPAAIAPPKESTPPALTEEQRALINRVAGEYELRARGALFPEAYREFRKDAAELRELAREMVEKKR